jgi:hypothetical protein
MKKIIFYIIIALIFVGCEDALQFDTLTSGDATVYPESIENAEQMMAGIYTTMNNAQRFVDRSYFFACEVASDDKLGGGGVNDINAQAIESLFFKSLVLLSISHPFR